MNPDVIIIGSGLAGLSYALQAAKKSTVLLVTKTQLLESNSHIAQGGIAAVFEPSDNFQKHIQDSLIAGAHHNDKNAVKYFVQKAPQTIKNLEALGVPFTKKDEKFSQNLEAGHSRPRIIHAADHSGKTIIETLAKLVKKSRNITIWEKSFAVDLIVKNKICLEM